MGLSGNLGRVVETKYIEELSKGKPILYQGEKYYSRTDQKGIIYWIDSSHVKVGTGLEPYLYGEYVKSRKQKISNN